MSREDDRRPRKNPARRMTPDGLEERSENIGDSSREGHNLRTEREAPLGRNRDAPVSVHETIARHKAQARQFAEHAATPDDARDAGINNGGALPQQDAAHTDAPAAEGHASPYSDGPAERPKPGRRSRAAEQQGDTASEPCLDNNGGHDRPVRDGGGERLTHGSSYLQRFDEGRRGRLKTGDSARLSGDSAETAAEADAASDKYKRGSAYRRRFEELNPGEPDAPRNMGHPTDESLRDAENAEQAPDHTQPQPESSSESEAPVETDVLSYDSTQRPLPERPGRLIHDRIPGAPKDAPRTKTSSPDAAKYIKPDTDKTEDNAAEPIEPDGTDGAPAPADGDVSPAAEPPAETGTTSEPSLDSGEERGTERSRQKKPGKLQFTEDETAPTPEAAPGSKLGRKLEKAQHRAERSGRKLDKARDRLPKKRRPSIQRTFDEKSQKPKRKLVFEEEAKSQREHMKGPLATRPVKAVSRNATRFAHSKVFQVEDENVGVKAAHRAEMLAEGGLRTAYRLHKTSPYRKVAKLEAKTTKLNMKASYQKALHDNPKLKSSILSRMAQKKKIQRQYAKAAREAQKASKRAKKAGDALSRAIGAAVRFVARHPVGVTVAILAALLALTLMSFIGALGSVGSSGAGTVAVSTYLAEDADILGAEAAYAGMEADLQHMLDNYAALNPGFDEYVFDLDPIWHDPYSLTAIISALHEGAWTLDEVQGTLAMLFERQYILTETDAAETRTRTEDVIDPATGLPTGDTVDVPYSHTIRTVTLENFNLSHLPIYIMGEDGLNRYAILMATLGGRPDLFPVSSFPNASFYQDYGRHDVPQGYLDADPVFAAIITEAEKYLGMPYVWGGYSPTTSFDCSGYVSWVLNNSGWDIGRLGAQGLYNISATVPAADAKPGDLIFFHSTYNAPNPVTHVGIYVGDGMMVHCGNPIGYASIETTYWQNHFYAFGKMY